MVAWQEKQGEEKREENIIKSRMASSLIKPRHSFLTHSEKYVMFVANELAWSNTLWAVKYNNFSLQCLSHVSQALIVYTHF